MTLKKLVWGSFFFILQKKKFMQYKAELKLQKQNIFMYKLKFFWSKSIQNITKRLFLNK